MFPMSRKPTAVNVEYTARGLRVSKWFADAYTARRFYAAKYRQGAQPVVQAAQEHTMSEQSTAANAEATPVVAEAPKAKAVASKKAPSKKPVAKAAAKKAVKGKAKAAPAKSAAGPKELGQPQIRVLKVLAKARGPMSGTDIADKAAIDRTMVGNQIGYKNAEINDRPVHQYNLLNRGYVRFGNNEEGVGVHFEITAAGRKALEKAS